MILLNWKEGSKGQGSYRYYDKTLSNEVVGERADSLCHCHFI
ncbi:hypothetical protein VCRA2113O23_20408 [Vibrio crassostreae]|nr:hypothetical protein VCRA2113O23_20408 [Vibrio crassostreae]